MKEIFKKAHEMAREIKREYPEVDYRTQFGLCLSYLLNNKEEEQMTKEKWYESLSEKEKSRLRDIAEARTGFLRSGETAEEWMARKKENFDTILEEKYQQYLAEIEQEKQREEERKQEQAEQEKQRQLNVQRGYLIIDLYQSNKYRCWAAEITGTDAKYGLAREFLSPVEAKQNSKTYKLVEGKYYNYLENNKQYFVKVEDGELIEMTKEEMMNLFRQ